MEEQVTREWLDYQADQIEALLSAHRQEGLVVGVQVSPRWVRFLLTLGYGTKISSVENLSEELALALGVPQVRVVRSAGQLAVETPLPDPEPVYLLSLAHEIETLPPVTPVLGLNADGLPYTLSLTAPEVTHVLIAGTTGCGKTELLRSLLLSLAIYNRQAHLQIALIDPKRRGLAPLDGLPHQIGPIATKPGAALDLLKMIVEEMERRDQHGAAPDPRIIVAVDEVGDLLSVADKEVENLLVRLAQRGREAGIHLILSTQRPSADAVPSALKANLPARLVGKVSSAKEALMATGVPGTDAERLMGAGDFLAVVGGQLTRFQAAYNGLVDIQRIIEYLRQIPSASNTTSPSPATTVQAYDEYTDVNWQRKS